MGEKVNQKILAFITIEPKNTDYIAYLSMEDSLLIEKDPAIISEIAIIIYKDTVRNMASIINNMKEYKKERKPIPARLVWKFGDYIFKLKLMLEVIELQINGLYGHIVRDLKLKRKWLEKVVIFRRYLPKESLIPESINWGKFEKGTRRKAERLRNGLSVDS